MLIYIKLIYKTLLRFLITCTWYSQFDTLNPFHMTSNFCWWINQVLASQKCPPPPLPHTHTQIRYLSQLKKHYFLKKKSQKRTTLTWIKVMENPSSTMCSRKVSAEWVLFVTGLPIFSSRESLYYETTFQ